MTEWCEMPYPEEALILTKDQEMAQEVVDAKAEELEKLIENGVFEIVPFNNQKTVSSRVCSAKYRNGIRKQSMLSCKRI